MPTIRIRPLGNLGNQMFQFMAAQTIASQVPGSVIANVDIPEWNLHYPDSSDDPTDRLVFDHRQEVTQVSFVDPDALAAALNAEAISRVELSHYCQNTGNLLPPAGYTAFFPFDGAVGGAGPDELLINIRLGDIANAQHPDYVLLPIAFYRMLVAVTGLRPVFLGQLDDGAYLAALKAEFPDAVYLPSKGAIADFQFIRNSCNIVPCISTFSWCAAWLSQADRIIFPVAGLFHPLQGRHAWLLPLDDARYSFYVFPIYYSAPQDAALHYHAGLENLWRLVCPGMLEGLRTAPRYKRRKADFIKLFDAAFYCREYPDVSEIVASGALKSALTHYVMNGFDENRRVVDIDPNRYFQRYVLAAIEVSQGDYTDAQHHYIATGHKRGYHLG
ncbi:hypothetical protein [Acidisphaera sp. L21]|uniref:hypothetical protein n=1 Tax=Acidisphaera sp. L21 TaxID=1641851 RepID=UPI00131EC8D4|nr:hypothetical protein [Acidisphaera sp. L21]